MVKSIVLEELATDASFNEAAYLRANSDVARAVPSDFPTGRAHFDAHGRHESRLLRHDVPLDAMRERKIERLLPFLRLDLDHRQRGRKYDFLTDRLREQAGISDTDAISGLGYDAVVADLIEALADGLVLDCGAGRRPVYYENVVNYEIVDYDTTDVLGVGESLPFNDKTFDGVISIAVLEHVRDPFGCAAELIRVLKPGGRLICCVPFLQPYHGYPHHYFNMTGQGLRSLFEGDLTITDHRVLESIHPIASLSWILQSWANGLDEKTREQFYAKTVRGLVGNPSALLRENWARQLPVDKQFELASATILFAQKPR